MRNPSGQSDGTDGGDGALPTPAKAVLAGEAENSLSGSPAGGVSYVSIPKGQADHAHHILFKDVIVGTREIRYLGSRDDKGRAQFQIKIIVDTEMLTSKTHFMGPDDMEHAHRFLERLFENLDPDQV